MVVEGMVVMVEAEVWEEGGDGGGGDGEVGEDGEVKAASVRPVSVANQTQCCGGLKSGVCTLI